MHKTPNLNISPQSYYPFITILNLLSATLLLQQRASSKWLNADNAPMLATRSPIALKDWARAEIQFILKLQAAEAKFANGTNHTVELKKYLEDFKDTHKNIKGYHGASLEQKAGIIAANPITSSLMTRRIVKSLMPSWFKIRSPNPTLLFPQPYLGEDELLECHMSMMRILHFHDIPVKDFCNGNILGVETGAHLNSLHCWEFAHHALKFKRWIYHVQFLEEALERSKVDGLVPFHDAQEALYHAIRKHDDMYQNYKYKIIDDLGAAHIFRKPLIPMYLKFGAFANSLRLPIKSYLVEKHSRHTLTTNYTEVLNWESCKHGYRELVSKTKSQFCWLETRRHPYWYINPLRAEFISRNPDVVQMYDMLGPKKISQILEVGTVGLRSSQTTLGFDEPELGFYRNSVQNFISEDEYPFPFMSVQNLAGKITGYRVEPNDTEFFQLAGYSFGGHYLHHYDAGPNVVAFNGHRMATLMFYLNEPELGGSTCFPYLFACAQPVKGSAILWYNYFTDGIEDYDLEHAACPVVIGSKWILTKWFYTKSQFLTAKCGLQPNERFQFIPNAK